MKKLQRPSWASTVDVNAPVFVCNKRLLSWNRFVTIILKQNSLVQLIIQYLNKSAAISIMMV